MKRMKLAGTGLLTVILTAAAILSPFGMNTAAASSESAPAEQQAVLTYTVTPKDELAEQKCPAEEVSISDNSKFAMANINAEADVYAAADANSEVTGKIYPTTDMEVVGTEGDWTQIKTGNVVGFVPTASLMFGDEGRVLMNAKCPKAAVIEVDTDLYAQCSTDGDVAGNAQAGDVYSVNGQLSGWYKISEGGEQGAEEVYVPADRTRVEAQVQAGKTVAELTAEAEAAAAAEAQAAAEAAKAAAEQKAAEETSVRAAQSVEAAPAASQGASVSATGDEVELLAHLLYCEAGSGYENCVAVGAVVMNRVKSSQFPNNIHDVIYQSGQFSPTWNGALDRAWANGVPQSCYDAANAAIGGYSNVGGCLYFRAGTNGTYVIGDNAFR